LILTGCEFARIASLVFRSCPGEEPRENLGLDFMTGDCSARERWKLQLREPDAEAAAA
jgi:hypothetical protein